MRKLVAGLITIAVFTSIANANPTLYVTCADIGGSPGSLNQIAPDGTDTVLLPP